jgi:hypothetical protein
MINEIQTTFLQSQNNLIKEIQKEQIPEIKIF